jgi:3-oxoacyl-[acyl-carrier-protein] synthase-3
MTLHGALIAGTGSCVPDRRLTNHDLEKMVDTSDDWIVQRTGIRERRIASADQSSSQLGLVAAQRALASSGTSPEEIDLIICATITPDMPTPSNACLIQHALGCRRGIGAMDLNAACSGFVYALVTATNFIKTGSAKTVLVVGAETLSRITDYTDRSTCILFGDGAGAAVLKQTPDLTVGVQAFELGADGSGAMLLHVPAGGSRQPATIDSVGGKLHTLKMSGREVFKFAVAQMSESIQKAMHACGLAPDQIKLVIPHQSNARIIDSAATKIGLSADRMLINIDRYGNTSAASVAIALDEAIRAGRCGPGDWIVIIGIGGGLTWATVTVKL